MRWRSTVNRWNELRCGRLRTGSHSGIRRVIRSYCSSASTTATRFSPAPSSPIRASCASGDHGSPGGAASASRSSAPRRNRTPRRAAASAARTISESSSRSASARRSSSPSRSTRPRPTSRSPPPPRPFGPSRHEFARAHASSPAHATDRPAAATSAISSSASAQVEPGRDVVLVLEQQAVGRPTRRPGAARSVRSAADPRRPG